MRLWPVLLILSVALAGCGSNSGSVSKADAGRGRAGSGVEASPNLAGTWEGTVEQPEGKKNDPGAAIAQGLMSMMGDVKLEFSGTDGFTFTMMGVPVEGKFERKGNTLKMTPQKMLGKTKEELEVMQKSYGQSGGMTKNFEPFEMVVSADGKSITMKEEGQEAVLVLHPAKPKEKVVPTVANDLEKGLVGTYTATVNQAELQKLPEKERVIVESIAGAASLELYEDNTFKMNMLAEFDGKWAAQGDTLTLQAKMGGMSTPMKMTIKDGKLIPVENGKDQQITFSKKKSS